MPVLSAKDNPPSRFPEKSIIESSNNWWVAKVYSRQEKSFAFDLLEQQIEYYLPLYTKEVKRRDNGKKRKSIIPLIPSYVPFVYDGSPYEILKNKRVSTILEVGAQEKFKSELQQLYLVSVAGCKLKPVLNDFKIGAEVEISAGPLKGIKGKVLESENNTILLSVFAFGEAILNVDAECVRALSK